MPRRKQPSKLPESFEEFAEKVEAAAKPKPKRPTAADVAGVGGMVEGKWSGIPIWTCQKCHGTTFNRTDSKVHKCKQARYADEEGLAE